MMISPEEMADELARKRSDLDRGRREATIGRFKLFLDRESASGDESHPAVAVRQALEAGEVTAALDYLDTVIRATKTEYTAAGNETDRARLEIRLEDLARWKRSLM